MTGCVTPYNEIKDLRRSFHNRRKYEIYSTPYGFSRYPKTLTFESIKEDING